MLQNLRDNSKGVVSFILIGFLVIIFALTGVDALFNWDTAGTEVASVNGETVTEMEVARAIAMKKQQILGQYGDQVPAEFLSDEYWRKPIIDNLTQRLVLTQAAKAGKMATNKKYLSEQIASTAQFNDEQGNFDTNRYQQTLRSMGLTHSTYTKLLSEDMVVNQLQAAINQSGFTYTSQLSDVISLSFQTRDLTYSLIPAAKVRDSIEVSDEELTAQYKASPDSYTSDEQVAVDYIELNVSDLMKSITISDDQLHKQYEQNLSTFVPAPERQAAHILIEDGNVEKLKLISDKLTSGEDFAVLAKQYSDDLGSKDQGGDLGFSKGDTFPAEFEAALAALHVGEISAPIKTDSGMHIIKLLAEKGSVYPSFEEQKLVLEDQLKRAEAENVFVSKLDALKDLSYNAESLSEVATELMLNVKNTGLFSRSGGSDLASNTEFITAAFSAEVLQDGNSSEVIELDPTRVVVLKKTAHEPSHLRALDEVKELITATIKDQKVRQLLAEQGGSIVNALRSGESFVDLAKSGSLELHSLTALTRSSVDLDMDLLRYAFSMPKPVANKVTFGGFITQNGDFAVIALESVADGVMTDVKPEQKLAISTQLAKIYGSSDFASYQKHLKDTADLSL